MYANVFKSIARRTQRTFSRGIQNMTDRESTFRLCEFDAFGFDIDHTIAKFRLVELFKLSYESVAKCLVEKKGYSSDLLKDIYIDRHLLNRGLFVDGEHGNILKLSKDGRVIRGSHGTRQLSKEELQMVYGQDLKWKHFAQFRKNVTNTQVNTRFVDTFFDVPFMIVWARLVDIHDKQGGDKGKKYDFFSDVYDAIISQYTPSSYSDGSSNFFREMQKNESKYLVRCSKAIEDWLKKLKELNKFLFIITSSYIDFASGTMKTVLGSEWKSYFDLTITYSKKPTFFSGDNPFLRLDEYKEMEPLTELNHETCVSQGNVKDLEKFIRKSTGKDNPKIVYFGDSIRSDCFPAKTFANWNTVLLLEEMDAEGYELTDGSTDCTNNAEEPVVKKIKMENRLTCTVDAEEKDYILSDICGPFLFDPLADDKCDKVSQKTLNTFWGSLISECCDITVPNLEYIAGIPLDFEFTRFRKNGEMKGFHPGRPSSLL